MVPWLRIHPVRMLAAFLLTAALLFGAKTAWQARHVEQPLRSAVLGVPGVELVVAGRVAGTRVFQVTLGPVSDLQTTYLAVDRAIAAGLGDSRDGYRITLVDARDEALEQAFVAIHFALYEAAARHTFTELAAAVAALGPEDGVERAAVRVDAHHIYLQLHRGDRHLYAVVPRSPGAAGPAGGAGGPP